MLLLHLFFYKKINVINFNHKTRMLYCKNEENLIFFYCKVLNINFFVNSVHETVFEKKQTFFRIRRILNFNKFLI
ncbi:hypothetical protein E5P55_00270 [Candidatus Pinguicoccus supinus]|uniref:Uncharacterized protein n=1 Tax=Candidatus Pinguicoccus supinus TaxID=2529394 RepID=A0A7T0BRQ5_9BACT|nr:hypothetical protein E5P55_00270 [Candidatus Pinguicoccus supinus]